MVQTSGAALSSGLEVSHTVDRRSWNLWKRCPTCSAEENRAKQNKIKLKVVFFVFLWLLTGLASFIHKLLWNLGGNKTENLLGPPVIWKRGSDKTPDIRIFLGKNKDAMKAILKGENEFFREFVFPSVPSGKCGAEGDDDMVLPIHLSCWLSPAPAEWDDEATLCDADFTGFTTPPEITFLEAFIHSSTQTMADSDKKKSINSGLLQFFSLTVQWCCNRRMHLMEALWKLPKEVPNQLFFRPTGFSVFLCHI